LAETGTFLSIDPLRVPPVDPYGYAANNPVQLADPRGTNPFLNALQNRTNALNNLADFGEDGISSNQLNAVECAGENVLNNVDEFQGELTTNISLPLPGALGIANAVHSVVGLFGMAEGAAPLVVAIAAAEEVPEPAEGAAPLVVAIAAASPAEAAAGEAATRTSSDHSTPTTSSVRPASATTGSSRPARRCLTRFTSRISNPPRRRLRKSSSRSSSTPTWI
jgi:hypothetical protein